MNTNLDSNDERYSTCCDAVSLIELKDSVGICSVCNKRTIFLTKYEYEDDFVLPTDYGVLSNLVDILMGEHLDDESDEDIDII